MKNKLKTRKSAYKRVKTKKNIIARKKAYKGHLLRKKSAKQLRTLKASSQVHKSDTGTFISMLPYGA